MIFHFLPISRWKSYVNLYTRFLQHRYDNLLFGLFNIGKTYVWSFTPFPFRCFMAQWNSEHQPCIMWKPWRIIPSQQAKTAGHPKKRCLASSAPTISYIYFCLCDFVKFNYKIISRCAESKEAMMKYLLMAGQALLFWFTSSLNLDRYFCLLSPQISSHRTHAEHHV